MSHFTVNGGRALSGDITVSGSKNAALPIIFSTLITRGVSHLYNLPDIGDVRVALELIEDFGAVVTREGSQLTIDTKSLHYSHPKDALVSKIRASTYLIGATLSRFGIAELGAFGGCGFQHRPIDLHILAATSFGGTLVGERIISHGVRGTYVKFPKKSVGATVNALILAAAAEGESRIENYAREPHVFTLIDFLRSAGARISVSEDAITVIGGNLAGGVAVIEGDPIEAGTYAALSLLTGGNIRVHGVSDNLLESFFEPLLKAGALLDRTDGVRLYGRLTESVSITAEPYPGFPTDLQPITAALLAHESGGFIEDRVWQGRFGYLAVLASFGVQYHRYASSAEIYSSQIRAASVFSPDLRGGAAALLLSLAADGESIISAAEIIERGYENVVDKLRSVGAEIDIKE